MSEQYVNNPISISFVVASLIGWRHLARGLVHRCNLLKVKVYSVVILGSIHQICFCQIHTDNSITEFNPLAAEDIADFGCNVADDISADYLLLKQQPVYLCLTSAIVKEHFHQNQSHQQYQIDTSSCRFSWSVVFIRFQTNDPRLSFRILTNCQILTSIPSPIL